jgi:hypothetical protein
VEAVRWNSGAGPGAGAGGGLLHKAFKKIHVRFVRELEKKFNGKVNCIYFPCLVHA